MRNSLMPTEELRLVQQKLDTEMHENIGKALREEFKKELTKAVEKELQLLYDRYATAAKST